MRKVLTERFVKSVTAGSRASPIFMDDEVIGFGVHVRENGRKTFTSEARRRRYFLGDHPTCTVTAARGEAKRCKRVIDGGTDLLETRGER